MKASRVAKNKKILILNLIFLTTLILVLIAGYTWRIKNKIVSPNPVNQVNVFLSPSLNPQTEITKKQETKNIPTKYLIENFPFQSQAPLANWDELHNEACEEASLALDYYYLNHKELTSAEMDKQILALVAFQEKAGAKQQNLPVAEALKLAQNFYKIDGQVVADATIADMKQEISQNHPVIVPTAGRLLGNPNFRRPGPVYHMLVVIGYDQSDIIVQDVGTHNGDHYRYNQKIFANAWHDWTGSDSTMEQGEKNFLVLTN